ncbi:MAG: CPBP family intramembrane metalloprotease [Lachnospiraceae bacterium]|jgi:sodium transport system permease protein
MKTSVKMTKIKAIYKKEMMDLLRDKKTLVMMLVVPLVIYPLIMMGSLLMGSAIAGSLQSDEYQIAVADDKAQEGVNGYDAAALRALLGDTEDSLEYHLKLEEIPEKSCKDALAAEEIDAYIVVEAKDTEEGRKNVFTIYYLSSKTTSSTAATMIEEKLERYKEQVSRQLLSELGLASELLLKPVEISRSDSSANEERVGSMLGMILPFLMISSILLGAFYPAVDTTAGEKERGTLETLLTLPVGNDELIIGKFFAVSTVAVASAVLNLVSMLFMSMYFYAVVQTDDAQALQVELANFVPALLIVVLCTVAFALFISAVTMCVTTFAKSFKEANNYATPLMLVVMFASFVAFVPNMEFTGLLAAVPIVNISLLISDILVFEYNFSIIMIVLVTNMVYAALAIVLLIRLYNSEELMFGEEGTSIQIFTGRGALKKGGVPTLSDAVLVLAASLLLLLYVGSVVQARFLLWGLLMTQLLILGVPLLASWYTKKELRETFSLHAPKPVWVLGAVLSEMGCYLLIILLSSLLGSLFEQDIQAVNDTMDYILEGAGFVQALLIIALAPAVCEEALFRGYFFSAARKRLRPAAAIIISGAVFGIYHLSLVKFFTTGLLGVLFCYVVYRTGSIFLTALMHFLNNAVAVFVLFYPEKMERLFPFLFHENPGAAEVCGLVAAGVVCLGAGLWLFNPKPRTKHIN